MVTRVCILAQDVGNLYGAERATVALAAGLRRPPGPVDARVLLIEEARRVLRESRYRDAFEQQEIPCAVMTTDRRFSRRLAAGIARHLRDGGFHVLHCVGPKATVHGWLAAREAPGVRTVATAHGWLARPDPKEWWYTRLERMCLRRFDRVVALSRHYDQWLRRLRVGGDRVVRIPTGFDVAAWPVRRKPAPAAGRPITVGMLARLSREKNHDLLIAAVRRVHDQGTTLRVVLAGEGPDRLRIERRIAKAGVADSVELRGYQEPEGFYRSVDALVLCSRLENQPYCVLEAMASGLPCMVSRVGGLPELVEDDVTGFVIAPDGAAELANRLQRLAADCRLAERLGAAGRGKLQREFTLSAQLEAHKELFRVVSGA